MSNLGTASIGGALSERPVLRLPLIFTLSFLALALLPRVQGNAVLLWSILGAGTALLLWQAALGLSAAKSGRQLKFRFAAFRPHWVQACLHTCIFIYWGWYWPEVGHYAPLIIAQILFAYAFDMLLCWTRRSEWYFGFGPIPIILSTNLFLWFRDDWFYLQFVMIAVGFLGKELIRWTKDGRKTHIFNPSAFSLSVFSLVLILTGSTHMTWGQEVAITLHRPEYIYLEIFLLGLVVQYLFSVTLVTLSAAAALLLLNLAYTGATGVYWFLDSNIPIAVFLGLHLLVTDPSTSPRTDGGRVMFGALYGASVFALYGLLEAFSAPTFYDKLLCVPLLNLSIQFLDRAAEKLKLRELALERVVPVLRDSRRNLTHMALWILLGGGMLASGFLGQGHVGSEPAFWENACDDGLRNGCRNLFVVRRNNCLRGSGEDCNALGVMAMDGRAFVRAPEHAALNFQKACDAGFEPGCENAAIQLLFHDGSDVLSNDALRRTITRLSDSCDRESYQACYLTGLAAMTGRGRDRDAKVAVDALTRACDLGSAGGCSAMAKLYIQGTDVRQDYPKAAAAFERACDIGEPESCVQIALMYRNGVGVTADSAKAVGFVQRACELGHPEACQFLPNLAD